MWKERTIRVEAKDWKDESVRKATLEQARESLKNSVGRVTIKVAHPKRRLEVVAVIERK